MFKSFSVSVIAGLALALASTGALAQKKQPAAKPAAMPSPAPSSSGGIGKGDMELGFFGDFRDDGVSTTFLVGGSVGRYLSDSLEMRVTAALGFIDAAGVSTTIFSPYVAAEYQFNTRTAWVPYVGGGLGFYMLGNDDIFVYSLFVTPTGGVKYFLNERTSVEYALSYQFPLVGEACTDIDCFDADVTTLQNTFRINIYY
jgi:hypothetical protein